MPSCSSLEWPLVVCLSVCVCRCVYTLLYFVYVVACVDDTIARYAALLYNVHTGSLNSLFVIAQCGSIASSYVLDTDMSACLSQSGIVSQRLLINTQFALTAWSLSSAAQRANWNIVQSLGEAKMLSGLWQSIQLLTTEVIGLLCNCVTKWPSFPAHHWPVDN